MARPTVRAEAMVRLSRPWDGLPQVDLRQHLLHYLNGKIDAKTLFPLETCAANGLGAPDLRNRLLAALQFDPILDGLGTFFE